MGMINSYFNFVYGSGSDIVGRTIKRQIQNKALHNQSYVSAIAEGAIKGFKVANKSQARAGGFFKSLFKNFNAIPNGWKTGKGLGKITGLFKGCWKALPAVFSSLIILGEIPNIYKAVKEKGIFQGIKEVAKTATRLGGAAIGSAIGGAFGGVVGSIAGWSVGEMIASKIVGKSYLEQTTEKEEQNKSKVAQNPTNPNGNKLNILVE